MATHKYIDKICCAILALALILTLLFMNAEKLGATLTHNPLGYESRLFDTSKVHTINIVMDNWEEFISNCENEEYAACSVIIDNTAYKNVAIRAKGNTSLSQVRNYGNNRYSFKIEFDHYDSSTTYYGLDKLSLNNMIQDNTYMKDYLCYQMMQYAGAAAPLCSYTQVLVNGEEWGLYLAVEGVEESFLTRNYGNDYGNLYKPDSINMGGFAGNDDPPEMPEGGQDQNRNMPQMPGFDGKMSGSNDVSLIYSDDEYDSYSNIFNNAKTNITDQDKDRLISSLKQLNENMNIEDVVDTDAVIRYFVAHNFVCNSDSYTGAMIHNYYLYEKDGRLSMLPWDYNLAFGGFQGGSDATDTVNAPIDTPVLEGSMESRPMLAWIFESEEYTSLYHQYFAQFIESYFTSGAFEEELDAVKAMISPYVEKDSTKFCTYEEFETGVDTLKQFCLLRAESVKGQLENTIPATSEGQKEDASSLIDASDISISDMGSMGGDGGGMPMMGPENWEENGSFPDVHGSFPGTNMKGGTPPEFPGSEDGSIPQFPDDKMPANASDTVNRKSVENTISDDSEKRPVDKEQIPNDSQEASQISIVLMIVSVVVLADGLVFALLYKRKGY